MKYLLTTVYCSAANIDAMRGFDTLEKAYEYWVTLRQGQALNTRIPWWEQNTRSCRVWEVSADKPPKLLTKQFEQMVARDYRKS